MTAVELEQRTIRFEGDCDGSHHCRPLAEQMGQTLRRGYDRVAALEIPDTLDDWRAELRSARKRVDRCRRRGYLFAHLDRSQHEDEIFEINTSATHRQGRPMAPAYLERQTFSRLPLYSCDRHAIREWGVFDPLGNSQRIRTLVAYAVIYRVGELALVSQFLGHAAYLRDEITFLLFAGALEREIRARPGVVVYNRWDSGSDGLREWKTRAGFREISARWQL